MEQKQVEAIESTHFAYLPGCEYWCISLKRVHRYKYNICHTTHAHVLGAWVSKLYGIGRLAYSANRDSRTDKNFLASLPTEHTYSILVPLSLTISSLQLCIARIPAVVHANIQVEFKSPCLKHTLQVFHCNTSEIHLKNF